MNDDSTGNFLYELLGESSIVYNVYSENLHVRVFREDFPTLFTDMSVDFLDFYVTVAGTKEEFLARKNRGQSASEGVTGNGVIAVENLGGTIESSMGSGTKKVTGDKLTDTLGPSLKIATKNPDLTEQQAYDEAKRQIEEKEWNASYLKFINKMAESSTLQNLLQNIENNEWPIKNFSDSGIPVYEHLDYLKKYLAAIEATTDLTYGADGSYARPDDYMLNQADDYGYGWECVPGIGYCRVKAGVLHYDDFVKLDEQQNIKLQSENRNKVYDSIVNFFEKVHKDAEISWEYSEKQRQERNQPFGDMMDALMVVPPVGAAVEGVNAIRLLKGLNSIFKGSSKAKLLVELEQAGVKYNKDAIVGIVKNTEGKLTWLETGNEAAGLRHVVARHSREFLSWGFKSEEEIGKLILNTVEQGGGKSLGNGVTIYDVTINGISRQLKVVTGSNGFIVTAHPYSL